jgi:NADPH:quinone reductase-like Zn-dependent oxidoreductase
MKAVQIDEFGGPEVLKVEEIEEPQPHENEVKVKLYAAGVNPADTYTISGNYGYNVPDLPYVPGNDGAGVIEEIGANVKNIAVGDRVYLSSFAAKRNTGTYAEKLVIDAESVFPLPEKMTFNEGAALGIPAFTAYQALFQKAKIRAGESVLIHGGSGAVGSMAVQMAKAIGAIVVGTSSTEKGRQSILDMGADFAIPHVTEENKNELLEITKDQGPDVIIEFLANVNLETDTKIIADNGRIIIVGSRDTIEITPRNLMTNEAIVTGMAFINPSADLLYEIHHGLSAFIASGAIKAILGDKFILEEAGQAHENVMETSGNGRTILEIRKEE